MSDLDYIMSVALRTIHVYTRLILRRHRNAGFREA